jgi:hypothetical protein
VEDHGGELELTEEAGHSRFSFRLPYFKKRNLYAIERSRDSHRR